MVALAGPAGVEVDRVGVDAGDDLLAPDDLAGGGAAGAPAVRDLADDEEPAAVLVVVLGAAQPGQRRGAVQDFANEGALEEQAQLDRAGGVAQRVGDELGREELGGVVELVQAPLLQPGADEPAGAADGGRVGGQRPGDEPVRGDAPQPGDEDGDVVAVLVMCRPSANVACACRMTCGPRRGSPGATPSRRARPTPALPDGCPAADECP